MAGFATRPSFAGHADSSAKTDHELTWTTQWGPASIWPRLAVLSPAQSLLYR